MNPVVRFRPDNTISWRVDQSANCHNTEKEAFTSRFENENRSLLLDAPGGYGSRRGFTHLHF